MDCVASGNRSVVTTVVADAKRRGRQPLIKGTNMVCPRCRREFNILQFKRLEIPVEFESDLTPVYKCPRAATNAKGEHGCGYLFAPAESTIRGSLNI